MLSLKNVISPVVNSSDEAGQKNDKAGDTSYDEPVKRISENLETSSTTKPDKRHKSRKRKRNSPSSIPEKVKRSNKKRRKKSRSRREKRKRWSSSSSSSSISSSSSSTKSENEIVDKRFKIVPTKNNSNGISPRVCQIMRTLILKIIFLIKTSTKSY